MPSSGQAHQEGVEGVEFDSEWEYTEVLVAPSTSLCVQLKKRAITKKMCIPNDKPDEF